MFTTRTLKRYVGYAKKGTIKGVKAKEFFLVVKEVDRYKEFLKMSSDSYIHNIQDHDNFDGTIKVNFKIYKDEFSSRVTCSHDEVKGLYSVKSDTVANPMFKSMVSVWDITDVKDPANPSAKECEIQYKIDFEFQSSWYNSVASYFKSIVGAATYHQFVGRAKEIYLKDDTSTDSEGNKLSPMEKSAIKKFEDTWAEKTSQLGIEIHIMNH